MSAAAQASAFPQASEFAPARAGMAQAPAQTQGQTRGSGTWESAVTTGEFAAIRSAGFEAVGRVLGAAVFDTGLADEYQCPALASGHGSLSRGYGTAQTEVSSFGNPDGTFTTQVRAMYEARRKAITGPAARPRRGRHIRPGPRV
jgi:hypothetical protein